MTTVRFPKLQRRPLTAFGVPTWAGCAMAGTELAASALVDAGMLTSLRDGARAVQSGGMVTTGSWAPHDAPDAQLACASPGLG
jgi:hypothetical protein